MTSPPLLELQEAEALIRQTPHLLLGLDYDGTLTPIVDEPSLAVLSTAMKQAIWALTQRDDVTVTVISGRAHADLQNLVGIPELIYAGNHGMEISGPGISFIEPNARELSQELHALALELRRRLHPVKGVFVEDKGLTLSVHYRHVAAVDLEDVKNIVDETVAAHANRFRVTLGIKVYEVRPLVAWNKGQAINWIKNQLAKPDALVVYTGDDTTDEDAFHLLRGVGVTIRVGSAAETAAKFLLPDSTAVYEFLRLVSRLREDGDVPNS
jgi:trehalose-phosphatase